MTRFAQVLYVGADDVFGLFLYLAHVDLLQLVTCWLVTYSFYGFSYDKCSECEAKFQGYTQGRLESLGIKKPLI